MAVAQKDVEDKQKEMIKLIAKKDEAFRMRVAAEGQLDSIERETKANKPQEDTDQDSMLKKIEEEAKLAVTYVTGSIKSG